jgi:hypothetical protein
MAIVRRTARVGGQNAMTGSMDARDRQQGSPGSSTPRAPVRDRDSLPGSAVLTTLLHGTIQPSGEYEMSEEHDLAAAAGILMSVLLAGILMSVLLSGLFWLILGSIL